VVVRESVQVSVALASVVPAAYRPLAGAHQASVALAAHHQNSDSGHLALGRTLAVHAPSGSKHPGKVSRGGGPMDGLTVPKMNID
jgi:hypothetical protein